MEHVVVEEESDIKVFGFWIYLMTDLILFAVLFATFFVLRKSTFGGPSGRDLFDMPSAFAETILLLTSSFTCSLATLALSHKQKNRVIFWFAVTFLLGLSFLVLEFAEFTHFVHNGASWQRSGFLSSFFALVGTHGAHIFVGLIWMLVTLITLMFRGLLSVDYSKIFRLALFWHFLDVVWIFIFSTVYLLENVL